MLTAIATWLTSKGVSLVLGYVARLLLDMWSSYQANAAQRDAGRAETEAAQAQAGAAAESEMTEEAAKDVSEDDAIAALNKGDA